MKIPFTVPAGLTVRAVLTTGPNGAYLPAYYVTAAGRPVAYVETLGYATPSVPLYAVSRYSRRPGSVGYVNTGYTYTAAGVPVALGVLAAYPLYATARGRLRTALRPTGLTL